MAGKQSEAKHWLLHTRSHPTVPRWTPQQQSLDRFSKRTLLRNEHGCNTKRYVFGSSNSSRRDLSKDALVGIN